MNEPTSIIIFFSWFTHKHFLKMGMYLYVLYVFLLYNMYLTNLLRTF